jgi:rhodanese-related sulfurtransferase
MKIMSLFAATMLLFTSATFAAEESPMEVAGATTVDTAKAKELFEAGAAFVDVRSDTDWEAGRIPGAIHIELKSKYNEQSLAAEVGKDEAVVIYCNGAACLRSSQASQMAVEWGFTKVNYYRDGYPAWKNAGHAVE